MPLRGAAPFVGRDDLGAPVALLGLCPPEDSSRAGEGTRPYGYPGGPVKNVGAAALVGPV